MSSRRHYAPLSLDEDGAMVADVDIIAAAPSGRSKPAISTMFSMRERASRGLLACTVVSEPGWPVFIT